MRKGFIGIICVLLMAIAGLPPAVLAAESGATAELAHSGEFDSIVIWCGSEDVIVKQGGSELRIELEAGTESSYQIRDNTDIPMEDRYFYYNKWDIIFQRKDRHSQTGTPSSSINVTIPDGMDSVLLRTGSGNIRVSGLDGVWLNVESENGGISVSDIGAQCVEAHSHGPVTLANVTAGDKVMIRSDRQIKLENVTAKAGVTINRKSYTAAGGVYNLTVEG